ncbi:MAG: SPASM domain-containing protein [Candidatus Stahlbacteria bacterium]|nr:SPASM domain-containing protein [Candidatus Stahlbacteria bacterium]
MSHYVLSLTIAPTLECNFECKYCYEREKKIIKNITMGDAEEEKLLEFLTNKVSKIETLFITWYGGEPLLELNRIISLSNKMKQICKKNKCKFNAALITNGYLLHENILKNLENIGIKEIQVTLDGSPEIHNSFRPLKGGKPTFSIILQNIKSVVNTQKFNLVIRVNISKQNIHSYKVLLQILKEEGLKEKVQIYLGKIISESSSLASYCFDNFDYSVLEIDFLKSLLATDWNIKLPSLTKNTYCMANTLSGYGIDPKLNVYKCWEVIGKEEFKIGVIDEGKIKFNENLFHWLSDDVFNEKKCRNCKILPLCMGGCLARKMIAGERECITFKYSLSKKLILFEQFYHKSKNPK